ncbi:ComEA family DNA-binding protein [Zhongshania aquimaris]|uniref:Helix-hairpin-helix domain-containing protein n=1 Tax=Zhongshania aquimaris TaxID=2857107 RepID=A0ABS6VQ57_9GAMM|nr:helix-hairpin-helix domain-containing protein [Zhongshania aquimaris]MBW2940386.1 helix-hairpin-helix domain-containing protein [Zhongshania aquimaris]
MKYFLCRFTAPRFLFALLLSLAFFNSANAMDINTASAEELQTLKGVGPKRAEAIIRYREEKGPIRSADDLLKVPGVGDSILTANGDELTFSAAKSTPPPK